ncbi:MAG: TlpA family protein disulfide reductase [Candidatus Lambdaproteobacteria bacterium]|nr:TlpA family protein disulfide reductase [Candidatus Lambdaproteobacteria bacterium]
MKTGMCATAGRRGAAPRRRGGSVPVWWLAMLVLGGSLSAAGEPVAADSPPLRPFALRPPASAATLEFDLPTLAGGRARLGDWRGKVVLLNFWATWCVPCVAELPRLQALQAAMAGRPFAVVAVDVLEPPGRVLGFLAARGLALTVLLDQDGAAAGRFGVNGLPASFVVDRSGRVVGMALGAREWDSPAALAYFRDLAAAAP